MNSSNTYLEMRKAAVLIKRRPEKQKFSCMVFSAAVSHAGKREGVLSCVHTSGTKYDKQFFFPLPENILSLWQQTSLQYCSFQQTCS